MGGIPFAVRGTNHGASLQTILLDPSSNDLIRENAEAPFAVRVFSHGNHPRDLPAIERWLTAIPDATFERHYLSSQRTTLRADLARTDHQDLLPKGVFIHRGPAVYAPQTVALDDLDYTALLPLLESFGYAPATDRFDPRPDRFRLVSSPEGPRVRFNPMRVGRFRTLALQLDELRATPFGDRFQIRTARSEPLLSPADQDHLLLSLRARLDPRSYAVYPVTIHRVTNGKRVTEWSVGVRSAVPCLEELASFSPAVPLARGSVALPSWSMPRDFDCRKEYADPAGLSDQRFIRDGLAGLYRTGGKPLGSSDLLALAQVLLRDHVLTLDGEFDDWIEGKTPSGYPVSFQYGKAGRRWVDCVDTFRCGLKSVRSGDGVDVPLIPVSTPRDLVLKAFTTLSSTDVVSGLNIRGYDLTHLSRRYSGRYGTLVKQALADFARGSGSADGDVEAWVADARRFGDDAAAVRQAHSRNPLTDLVVIDLLDIARNYLCFRGGNSVEALAQTSKSLSYDRQRANNKAALRGDRAAALENLAYAADDIALEEGIARRLLPPLVLAAYLGDVSLDRASRTPVYRLTQFPHERRANARYTHLDSGVRRREERLERERETRRAVARLQTVPLTSSLRGAETIVRNVAASWNPVILEATRHLIAGSDDPAAQRYRTVAHAIDSATAITTRVGGYQLLEHYWSGLLEQVLRGLTVEHPQGDLFGLARRRNLSLAQLLHEPLSADAFYENHRRASKGFTHHHARKLDRWVARRYGLPDGFSLYADAFLPLIHAYARLASKRWSAQRGPFLLGGEPHPFFTLGTVNAALLPSRLIATTPDDALFHGLRFPKRSIPYQTDIISFVRDGTSFREAPKERFTGIYGALERARAYSITGPRNDS